MAKHYFFRLFLVSETEHWKSGYDDGRLQTRSMLHHIAKRTGALSSNISFQYNFNEDSGEINGWSANFCVSRGLAIHKHTQTPRHTDIYACMHT
jgi:hypothetical protein